VNILHEGAPDISMRIAIVSTPFVRVPPNGYGGTELFCAHLAGGLLARGHEVTLFATGDSEFAGELRSRFREAQWPPSDEIELAHVRWALQQIARHPQGFDAVQINSVAGLEVARDLGIPVVYTIHHHRDENFSRIYAAHPEAHYVAISRRQLELEVPLSNATVIHHGVHPADYPPSTRDQGYLLHLGRFAPEKGTHLAIDAAHGARLPLILAGRVHTKDDDQQYSERELSPRLELPGIKIAGEADYRRKVALLRGARALLCPIQWEEPFGLIAIEAMLSGTPVIGFARGSFPEIIDVGVTGLLVTNLSEMERAIHMVRSFNRMRCAARARQRFSAERMVKEYEPVFEAMAARKSSPRMVVPAISSRQSRLTG
jgi:glycosyltransferase involved in cell wall biosynthesis